MEVNIWRRGIFGGGTSGEFERDLVNVKLAKSAAKRLRGVGGKSVVVIGPDTADVLGIATGSSKNALLLSVAVPKT